MLQCPWSDNVTEQTIDGDSRSSIRSYFGGLKERIFKPREIGQLIGKQRAAWGIPQSCSIEEVISAVTAETGLRLVKFTFPNRPESRYLLGSGWKVQPQNTAYRIRFPRRIFRGTPKLRKSKRTSARRHPLLESQFDRFLKPISEFDIRRLDFRYARTGTDRIATSCNRRPWSDRTGGRTDQCRTDSSTNLLHAERIEATGVRAGAFLWIAVR